MTELSDLFETWYQLMVSILLYTNPAVKYFELASAANESLMLFNGSRVQPSQLDNIILAAVDCDAHQVCRSSNTNYTKKHCYLIQIWSLTLPVFVTCLSKSCEVISI